MNAAGMTRAGAARHTRRAGVLATLVAAMLALAGCGLQIPADPDGTENRVRGDTLNVGVTNNPPWADTDGSGAPTGTEVELIERFAAELDAEVRWTEGSEASLVDALEQGELDVVVGGFLEQTPWGEMAAVTRWYSESENDRGGRERHVMLARMGENRFLVTLEAFLDRSGS